MLFDVSQDLKVRRIKIRTNVNNRQIWLNMLPPKWIPISPIFLNMLYIQTIVDEVVSKIWHWWTVLSSNHKIPKMDKNFLDDLIAAKG